MSETTLVNALLIWLKSQGAMVWRNNSGMAYYGGPGQRRRAVYYGLVGSSDILGCYRGRMLCVEAKRPGKVPTWAQQQFLDEAKRHGAFAVVVHSVEEVSEKWAECKISNSASVGL